MKKVTFIFDRCKDCPFYKEVFGMAYCPKLKKEDRKFSTYLNENITHKDCPLEDKE